VDMSSRLVTVMGKGHNQRTVRFGAKTRQAMLKYLSRRLEARQDSSSWITYRTDGEKPGPLTLRGLQMVFRNLGEKAGVTSSVTPTGSAGPLPYGDSEMERTFTDLAC